ncbi:DME family drug/metabolite transporter [Thermobifida halotolerans]|uniref:DMT family transporter n=1 Tax=Thermobifida halotolerans TaxID=483545 RepID=UPI001FB48137|nr:DMT family transporter [Thermobifida halotolerans]
MSETVLPRSAPPGWRGPLLLALAGVLWGTGGFAGSVLQGLTGVHPLATACYRLLVGGAVATGLLAAAGRLRRLPRTAAAVRRATAAGVLLAAFQACYFAAIAATSVSLATLITIGSVPVFVTSASALLERRLPRPALLAAVGCGVSGLVLLAGFPGSDASPGRTALGMGCALAAGVSFSALTLVNRRPVPGLDPLGITALGCLLGGVLLLPVAAATGMGLTPTPAALGALLYLGVAPTALAYLAYFGGLRRTPATAAALAVVLEPLTATLLSALLLDETLTPVGLLGAALLFAAILLEYVRPARR